MTVGLGDYGRHADSLDVAMELKKLIGRKLRKLGVGSWLTRVHLLMTEFPGSKGPRPRY